MKKAILGGTFDPIHNGHIYIAYKALQYLNLDKIIFMPSGNPPHKKGEKITDGLIRKKMINKAIKSEVKFELSDYEIKKQDISFTYKTLEYFNRLEPNTDWYFLTGTDCLMEIDTWKNVDRIFNSCNFVVFNRSGYDYRKVMKKKDEVEKKYNKQIIYLDIDAINISSTQIRSEINEGKDVRGYLPYGVYDIIKEFKLYR